MCLCLQATEVISKLYTTHQAGEKNSGFDVEGEGAAVKDVAAVGVWDLYLAKLWGIKLATNAAATILRVDQVCRYTVFFSLSGMYIVRWNPLINNSSIHYST